MLLLAFALSCQPSSNPDNASQFALADGWQVCRPDESACTRNADWKDVSPDRPHQLFFRIHEPTRLYLRRELPPVDNCSEPAVYFGVINLSFTAHWNGREIYRFGNPEVGPRGFAGRPYHLIPLPAASRASGAANSAGPGPDGRRMFSLQIWSDFRNVGIDGGPPILGCRAELLERIVRRDVGRFLIGVLAIIAGIGGFLVFLRARDETVYATFALFCLTVGLYMIGNRSMRLQHVIIPVPLLWFYIEHFSLYWMPAALALFLERVSERSRPARLLAWTLTLMALTFMLVNLTLVPARATFGAYLYAVLVPGFASIYVVIHVLRRGPREVRILVAGIGLFFLPGLGDALWALGIWPWWPGPLAQYGFSLLLIATGVTVWRRYDRIQNELQLAHQRLQTYVHSLEDLVDQRTAELRRSLEEVSRLKEQQDGDYLLISRVLEPMARGTVDTERIYVDSFIRQHKRFEFRGFEGELGGDLCMAEELHFNGEACVTWMNADAMGKSVQGASGAVVLATAFRAFLDITADGQLPPWTRAPSDWLLRLVEELHRVFRSFQGRMMISFVAGLTEERTGRTYVVNAGHPASVLLRAGRARRVLEATLDPIGSLDVDRAETVRGSANVVYVPESVVAEIQLEPGDVLIAGSDGRDDLRVLQPSGKSVVAAAPGRFLEIVERTGGNLAAIQEELERRGELVDDLSLLRVEYRRFPGDYRGDSKVSL